MTQTSVAETIAKCLSNSWNDCLYGHAAVLTVHVERWAKETGTSTDITPVVQHLSRIPRLDFMKQGTYQNRLVSQKILTEDGDDGEAIYFSSFASRRYLSSSTTFSSTKPKFGRWLAEE
jgi:hypothetical protein